jgi:hypothetical protein
MTWGAIGGAAVSVVGGALMSDGGGGGGGGGAGSSSQSRDPWMPAAPWLMNNLVSGQNLQNAYAAQPFSNAQNQAYNNQGNQSAYMRALVPDLLGQISGQTLGFDRSSPNARPSAFNFASDGTVKGLLAQMANGQNNSAPMQNTPQVAPPKPEEGTFTQQGDMLSGMNMSGQNGDGSLLGSGGYGTFKYGMPMPQPGTQQYRDMSAYFANGGLDPNDKYGRGAQYRNPNPGRMGIFGFGGGSGGTVGGQDGNGNSTGGVGNGEGGGVGNY